MTIEHDRLFKELISNFFGEFIQLFFSELAEHLAPETIEFIDKEFFTDIVEGETHEADLIIKAKLRQQESFFLVHIENQAQWQSQFPKRMFRYFTRLHEKYQLPIFPIALLSFDKPKTKQPDSYNIEIANLPVLQFRYEVVQLNRLDWRTFLNRANPVASALMSKMEILILKIDPK